MTIRPIFAWYDLWVGAYWDRKGRKLYLFPIPMFGVVIGMPMAPRRIRVSERAVCKMIGMAHKLTQRDKIQMSDYLQAVAQADAERGVQ